MNNEQSFLLDIIQNSNNKSYLKNPGFLTEIDWVILLEESKNQKIFPYVYTLLRGFAPAEWKQEYNKHEEKVKYYLDELSIILKSAKDENLTLVLQKGFAISKLVYNNLYIRKVGDIDFVIRETDIERADSILRGLGYVPACGKKNYWEITDDDDYRYLPMPVLKDDNHHEFYGYIKKNSNIKFTVELGRYLHKTVREPHINDFLNHSKEINLHNVKCLTFDLIHTFLCLCENLYDDAEEWYSVRPSLKNCLDILLFIEKYSDLNWEYVKNLTLE